jgi:hypothetical protein
MNMTVRDLAELNLATHVRLLDAQHQVIGEAKLGEFSLHGDGASCNLVDAMKADEPCYFELIDDDGRVIHRGPASEHIEVEALVEAFRQGLKGEDR